MRQLVFFALFVIGSIVFVACQPKQTDFTFAQNGRFLFLAHTYKWYHDNKIDPRIKELDFSAYEMLWLGGDLCVETSRDAETLKRIDSVFHIGSPSVLWAIGNHDLRKGSLTRIEKATNRKSFYAYYHKGITFLVLNTNIDKTALNNVEKKQVYQAQNKLITAISDSISASSHLVVLSHNVVWRELDTLSAPFANYSKPFAFSSDSTEGFKETIYPLLQLVQERGVKVVWVAGDMGKWAKSYSFQTPEGVVFLASGINNSVYVPYPQKYSKANKDQLLIFNYKNRVLDWYFADLNFLYIREKQKEKAFSNPEVNRLCNEIDSLYSNQSLVFQSYERKIRSSVVWNKAVKEKALKRNISFGEMRKRDARFMAENFREKKLDTLYNLVQIPFFQSAKRSTSSTKRDE